MAGSKADATRRMNYHYMADAMRMLEWDLHQTVMTQMRIPDEWHEIAQDKGAAKKTRVTIRLDDEIVRFFRSMGPDWQPRVNRVLSVWVHARLAGLIRGAETMDYLKRREDQGFEGQRPEFGDIQRAYDAMLGSSSLEDQDGVPMAGKRGMSVEGRKALMALMKERNGMG
ncbi:BrnA antitoxin family protein [Paracoccus sp. 11-3]|uniref:BrnA antitoxin family protein n=1 Tax=Paracoccus amoyensis TaxID=2760093 RepID=A0A926GFZ2_9RHOB|nr:BrnA antitoxin family protein [Paracoccus amoyensis]MBC9246372.1 BrnA antitoxin family protein [Paracoccus amoyensis]